MLNRFLPYIYCLQAILLLQVAARGDDNHWVGARPDGHAPIGVMADHAHKEGEVMLSYRYGSMSMDSTQDSSGMEMHMHMLGAMYAPSDAVTLMVMAPFKNLDMDMANGNSMESSGLGDVKISGLIPLWENDRRRIHLTAGISYPTGSIKESDAMVMPPGGMPMDMRLGYPMQLGSGTFDLLPGLTYFVQKDESSWGAQASSVIRLGENSEDYTFGNRFMATVWYARNLSKMLSASVRIEANSWGKIDGQDSAMNPMMGPAMDPANSGGDRIDLLFGLNLLTDSVQGRSAMANGHRLAIEVGFPIHQDLNGNQMETDLRVMLGWQWAC